MLALVEGSKNLRRLCREYETESVTVHLKELVGGAFSLYAAATIRRTGGVHVFVAEDRDAAAYLLNDLYALLDERRILFFPSSYKRSIVYGAEDAQGRRAAHGGAQCTADAAGGIPGALYLSGSAGRTGRRRGGTAARDDDRAGGRPPAPCRSGRMARRERIRAGGFRLRAGAVLSARRHRRRLLLRREPALSVRLFSTRRSTRSGGSTFRASCRRTSCSRPRSFPTSMRAKADGCRSSRRRATCAIGFSMRITPCGAWTICGGGCSPRRTIPPAWTVR